MFSWPITITESTPVSGNCKKTFDVIVIGGGLSGLTSAYHLLATCPDLDVLVIDAKDRLGGRIFTAELKGANGVMDKWDLGAQWVSNSQTHIMDLLLELGLKTYPQFLSGKKLMQIGGYAIREYEGIIPKMDLLSLIDLQWFLHKIEKLCSEIDVNDPYSHPNGAELDSMTVETYTRKSFWTKAPKEAIDVAVRTTFGIDPSRLSVLFFATYAASAGGVMKLFESEHSGAQEQKIEGGASQVVHRLAELVGKENIGLSMPVTRIFQIPEGNNGHSVGVVTANGVTFVSRHVIMAIPLHLVSNIEFSPVLPEKRRLLMTNMPIGHLSKYVVTYSKPFWRVKGYSGEIVSNGGPKVADDCDNGPLSVVYDATTHNGSPALVGFFGGKHATQWCSKPAEMRKLIVLKSLAKFFGDEALAPLDYFEKIWSEEPFIGGCPVNVGAPGIMEYVTNHLRTPFGRIHWAGTETAAVWCGYMSGAVQAGRRAAKEVLYHLRPNLLSVKDLRDTVYLVKLSPNVEPQKQITSHHNLVIFVSVIFNVLVLFYMFQGVE